MKKSAVSKVSVRHNGSETHLKGAYTPPRKVLWTHWDSLPLPPLLELNLSRTRTILADWDVRFMTTAEFLSIYYHPARASTSSSSSSTKTLGRDSIPALPSQFASLSATHKADFIRLWLLAVYGGLWADIGIVFNRPLDSFYDACVSKRVDLGGFFGRGNTRQGTASPEDNEASATAPWDSLDSLDEGKDVRHPEQDKDRDQVAFPSIENFFLLAPQGSPVVRAWLDEYADAAELGFHSYARCLRALAVNVYAHRSPYFAAYQALQAVLQLPHRLAERPVMYLEPTEDSMYKVPTGCRGNKACVLRGYRSEEARTLPYIKLSKFERFKFPLEYFTEVKA